MWVDVNEPLGRMVEGFKNGVYKYSSKIDFDPDLVENLENAYGFAAKSRIKTLKDNFTRLEQVSMSTRTLEKKKIKAREDIEIDKYGLKNVKGLENYLENKKYNPKSKVAETLHRRTSSNLFRLTTAG
jgi:hypothetical protein